MNSRALSGALVVKVWGKPLHCAVTSWAGVYSAARLFHGWFR
ncbi:hypothetical protein [Kitasatospora sp. CB02891]|nr:hypothetical protein [Kitasatospora sp. CB02891]